MSAAWFDLRERAAWTGRAFLVCCLWGISPGTAAAQAPLADEIDSLHLEILKTEVARAEEEARATNFWHRILPEVSLSAGFALRNVFFVDPATLTTIAYPRDAYHLSVSLSLSEVVGSPRHAAAQLRLRQVEQEFALGRKQLEQRNRAASRELARLGEYLREQLALKEELLKCDSLRFQQGTIDYAAFVASQLGVLTLRNAIRELLDRADNGHGAAQQ